MDRTHGQKRTGDFREGQMRRKERRQGEESVQAKETGEERRICSTANSFSSSGGVCRATRLAADQEPATHSLVLWLRGCVLNEQLNWHFYTTVHAPYRSRILDSPPLAN